MQFLKTFMWVLLFIVTTGIGYSQTGWSLQTNPTTPSNTNDLGKVQFVSSTEGWISAPNGILLHTTDAGANWSIVTPFPNDTVSSVADPSLSMSWVNQMHGWKINWLGTTFKDAHGAVIQQTTDGGVSWTKKVLSSTAGDVGMEVQFADENNGWALIYNFSTGIPQFLRTTDGGSNWNPFTGAGIFYFIDADNGWAYASTGPQGINPPYNIYHTTNGGTNWSKQFDDSTSGGYNAIRFTDLNNGWIVGDSSKILKTTDGGSHWSMVTNTGINSGSRSKCLFFIDGNTGWIGTNDGIQDENPDRVILHTTDGGASWIKQYPPINNAVFSIYFEDTHNGWFTGGSCVQNCSGPDSLKIWQGAIGHTSSGGGVTGVEKSNNLPTHFSLSQNYPNPFNPTTTIGYSVPKESFVTIKVYDILGKEVEALVNGQRAPGNYDVQFNASKLPSGTYFYRIKAGDFMQTKKLVLMK